MDLIKLNNYIPPAPSTYDISYSDVDGEKTQVEDGTTYIERVRTDVPKIKVCWTNLTMAEVKAITEQTANDVVKIEYFYGDLKYAEMTVGERSLKLKHIEGSGNTFWDLSFSLEG